LQLFNSKVQNISDRTTTELFFVYRNYVIDYLHLVHHFCVASLLFHVIYTRLTLSVMGIKLRAAVLSYFQQLNCHLQSCLLILSVTYN